MIRLPSRQYFFLAPVLLLMGCDIGSPKFVRSHPAGLKKWVVTSIYEIKKQDFSFPQSCLINNHVEFESDYFDDDEPNAKPIVLRVAKSDFPKVQKLLVKDAKENHYELMKTAAIEKTIEGD